MLCQLLLTSERTLNNTFKIRLEKGTDLFWIFLGFPLPLNSILLSIFCEISSTKRLLPVNWPRWTACRIQSHSPSGMVPLIHSRYFLARSFSFWPSSWKMKIDEWRLGTFPYFKVTGERWMVEGKGQGSEAKRGKLNLALVARKRGQAVFWVLLVYMVRSVSLVCRKTWPGIL